MAGKAARKAQTIRFISFSGHSAVGRIAVRKCRIAGTKIMVIVCFTNKTTAISHRFNLVVFGGALFKCSAAGITHNTSRTVIIFVALAFQRRIHNRAVFDG